MISKYCYTHTHKPLQYAIKTYGENYPWSIDLIQFSKLVLLDNILHSIQSNWMTIFHFTIAWDMVIEFVHQYSIQIGSAFFTMFTYLAIENINTTSM